MRIRGSPLEVDVEAYCPDGNTDPNGLVWTRPPCGLDSCDDPGQVPAGYRRHLVKRSILVIVRCQIMLVTLSLWQESQNSANLILNGTEGRCKSADAVSQVLLTLAAVLQQGMAGSARRGTQALLRRQEMKVSKSADLTHGGLNR